MRRRNLHQVLVFTRTKLMAGRLASQLDRDGVEAISIHGDRSQPERERALAAFKAGEVRVLVATDVAARGLDIESLPLVVNYELPHTPHDYVHRIGRTGRAGATGHAISLVAPEEEDYLKQVNRLLKRDLPVRVVKGYEPSLGRTATRACRRVSTSRSGIRSPPAIITSGARAALTGEGQRRRLTPQIPGIGAHRRLCANVSPARRLRTDRGHPDRGPGRHRRLDRLAVPAAL